MDTPSRHHLLWPKNLYSKRTEHRFRNQPGLVIPGVPRSLHDALHIEVPAPPKPTHEEMVDLFDKLAHVPDERRQTPFWGLLSVVEYYSEVEGERQFAAQRISRNLLQQLCVLSLALEAA